MNRAAARGYLTPGQLARRLAFGTMNGKMGKLKSFAY